MNPDTTFPTLKVLVAEDDYLHASSLARSLEAAGAGVAGPVATLAAALRMLEREADIKAAVLDVELHGELVFPVAVLLRRKGIPFVFVSEQPAVGVPFSFQHVPWLPKPAPAVQLLRLLGQDQVFEPLSVVGVSEKDLLAA
ncbi:response regulator [Sabulicella glaciei]|uniref:Response regulator n=1 Tax=Sabulicella glaciei TaxID=2984948 RepID=A0ABT3P064_9PROT|nr:response regulator [Roseococcus sp. MDT2-1-1]MCW8087805.1 response regulator [Roseococcus sp. MDT2-1-1]